MQDALSFTLWLSGVHWQAVPPTRMSGKIFFYLMVTWRTPCRLFLPPECQVRYIFIWWLPGVHWQVVPPTRMPGKIYFYLMVAWRKLVGCSSHQDARSNIFLPDGCLTYTGGLFLPPGCQVRYFLPDGRLGYTWQFFSHNRMPGAIYPYLMVACVHWHVVPPTKVPGAIYLYLMVAWSSPCRLFLPPKCQVRHL